MRKFYRLVKTANPTLADFRSQIELGRNPPADATDETREAFAGVSFFGTMAAIRRLATRPGYVATVELERSESVRWKKTFGRGHYTIWADKEVLLAAVVETVAL